MWLHLSGPLETVRMMSRSMPTAGQVGTFSRLTTCPLPLSIVNATFSTASPGHHTKFQSSKASEGRCRRVQWHTVRSAVGDKEGGISGPPALPPNTATPAFGSLERMIASTANAQPGLRSDWQEIEGCWVLFPKAGAPKAVVHFVGGAFAGAAPQLTYRLLMETLANNNLLVIATPYSTSFDRTRIADEVQFKFDRCLRALSAGANGGMAAASASLAELPVFGLGHSLGCLVHLLICSRYAVQRAGNVFMSYNDKPLEDIPFLAPGILPSARLLGPILSQLAASPLSAQLMSSAELLRGMSPTLVRQVLPVVDQLLPVFLDVANGTQSFTPGADETQKQLRAYYGVHRNLLIRFANDSIDETPTLATMLQANSSISAQLDLTVRTVRGDHVRPLSQALGQLPGELTELAQTAAARGTDLLGRFSSMAAQAGFPDGATSQLDELAKGVTGITDALTGTVAAGNASVVAEMQELADELSGWMGGGALRGAEPAKLPGSPAALPR